MRKIFVISIAFLLSHTNLISQELKKKTKTKYRSLKEVYYIDKTTKKKNGYYYLLSSNYKDTLAKGYYSNDLKSGIWNFSDSKGKNYLKYNYNSQKLLYYSDSITYKDTAYVKLNEKFVFSKVDSPPIYIGYKNEVLSNIVSSVNIPTSIFIDGKSGTSIISFVVSKDGIIKDCEVVKSFETSFEKEIVKTIYEVEGRWIPARFEGNPIDSKIILVITVNEEQRAIVKKNYIWPVIFSFSSSIRPIKL